MENGTATHAPTLSTADGLTAIIAYVSLAFVAIGACATVVKYASRLCRGQDFVSDCIVGGRTIHVAVDGNGDGKIVASEKLVIDTNTRKVTVVSTGQDSPSDVSIIKEAANQDHVEENPAVVVRRRSREEG